MNTLYYGGPILTDEGESPEALLVIEGKIRGLGTREDLRKKADAEEVNLQGNTLSPAFIDAHSHITAYAATLTLAALHEADSVSDMILRLKEFEEQLPAEKNAFLLGFGYDHNHLREKRHPRAAELDAAFPDRPVVITHASGHMGVANTVALRRLGIQSDTPSPAGGVIGKDAEGELNGYLEEKAFSTFSARIPPLTAAQMNRALRKAEERYLAQGITTIQDGFTTQSEWELLTHYAKESGFLCDVVCYPDLEKNAGILRENPAYVAGYVNHLKIGGYKIFLDGSPQGKTAWMSRPYEGEESGYSGYPIHTDESVEALCKTAAKEKIQLLAHCNGDAAAAQFIEAIKKAKGAEEMRPVMIHAQLVRRDQLKTMKELSIIPSFFTAHSYYWGDVHLKNLGRARADFISPAKSAEKLGIPFTFHQDTPVIEPNMLETIWCAVNRVTKEGARLAKEECISRRSAWRAVTKNAAYAYFEEGEKGEIKEGARADLIILDGNLLEEKTDLRKISILRTIKDGKTVWKKR